MKLFKLHQLIVHLKFDNLDNHLTIITDLGIKDVP